MRIYFGTKVIKKSEEDLSKMTSPLKLNETNSIALKHLLEPKREIEAKIVPQMSKKKPRRRDKSDLGEHFIAPDGGVWAWMVCIAAGVSNLSIYPCMQQFGFLYRDRLIFLGLSNSQITSLFNTNNAISACSGLLNGPMFRRFTYRQVGMAGSILLFIGIVLSAFCTTFLGYLVSYSLLYGFGMGISVSASALAINTYFKNKRRRAMGFSWTITGIGPIFLPHVVTFLLAIYEMHETVLMFAAFALHSFVSALIYQPVHYHAPVGKSPTLAGENSMTHPSIESTQYLCKFCELQKHKERSIFSSQYLYQEDDEGMRGYEITEPGIPMLSRANDGWFGSKLSLASSHSTTPRFRKISSCKDIENGFTTRLNKVSEEDLNTEDLFKPNYFKREHDDAMKRTFTRTQLSRENSSSLTHCTCAEERALLELETTAMIANQTEIFELEKEQEKESNESPSKDLNYLQKIVVFFDLDLLRDFTYVNLVIGLTTINFGELNFSILVPFILKDYGFNTKQITLTMSVLGSLDLAMRFFIPFISEKIPWDNRIFFLIGVLGIALGRTVVACTRSFYTILCCFVFMGMCKGIRTIFWPLIIPSYVPLKRLPAASGLQLLITGLFTLAAGPFVGIIRDHYDYSVVIHFLNFMTFFAAFSWTAEFLVRRYFLKRARNE